jgi:hypothetical protein
MTLHDQQANRSGLGISDDARRRAARGVLLAVSVLFVANALQTLADPDLWGHLQFGLAHREEGRLARTDPYSYTAQGRPWTNHEWLTEWTFAVAYTRLGTTGLMLLRATLLAATLAAVGVICVRRKLAPAAVLVLAMAGVTVMAEFFRIRPQMFTYALMAWLLVICDGHRPGKRLGLCLIPLMILAWTNFHGGFVAGLGIFGLYWLSFVAEAWNGPNRTRKVAFLAAVMAAAWGATLVNPYGLDYWRFVLYAVHLPRPAITEWKPIFAHNAVLQAIYLATALAAAAAWLFSTRRGHWVETIVFALGVVLAGKHVRHLPFLMLFASLVLARRAPEAVAIWGPRIRRRLAAVLEQQHAEDGFTIRPTVDADTVCWPAFGLFLLVLMASVGGGWKLGRNLVGFCRDGAVVVCPEDYPVQAVELLRQNGYRGNLDCGFNWGEYCIFKLYPQCRVFCDGRYETVYPHEVSRLALATEGEVYFRRRLYDFATDAILAKLDDPFAEWAAGQNDFVEVYRDETARLLLRRTPQNARWIQAAGSLKNISTREVTRRFPA